MKLWNYSTTKFYVCHDTAPPLTKQSLKMSLTTMPSVLKNPLSLAKDVMSALGGSSESG